MSHNGKTSRIPKASARLYPHGFRFALRSRRFSSSRTSGTIGSASLANGRFASTTRRWISE